MRKKDKEIDLSSSTGQDMMRKQIIARLDDIILHWNPSFAKFTGLDIISEQILQSLKSAREILASIFLPRKDKVVGEYISIICDQLAVLEKDSIMTNSIGDDKIKPAAHRLVEMVELWSKLQ